jgi:hypothetical protein
MRVQREMIRNNEMELEEFIRKKLQSFYASEKCPSIKR